MHAKRRSNQPYFRAPVGVHMPVRLKKVHLKTIQSFTELSLPLPLAHALQRMEFITPTPVQAVTIPAALAGRDIMATAQTGTGKTAAFGVPLLTWLSGDPAKRALILAPTRELAAQIFGVLRQLGNGLKHRGALVIGGESFHSQVVQLEQGCDYVVATPGRMNDHLEKRTIDISTVDILILDEVDRMLDMGFLPQIRRIVSRIPENRQTMLFSATIPSEIQGLANTFLINPVRISIGPETQPAPQVQEETIRTTQEGKNAVILREVKNRAGSILIFTRTKARANRLTKLLICDHHAVVLLHGNRSQAQRKSAMWKFRRGSHRIMVATDLAGRGIDVEGIGHVINYDVPATREDYIHRIGRTGRNGKTGSALSLLLTGDTEGEHIVSGVKRPSRIIYRSRRRFR